VKLKVMDLQLKTIATQKNAPSMVSGVSGVSVVKHVVEERRPELVQIQRLDMEELIVNLNIWDMDLEIQIVATLTVATAIQSRWLSGVSGDLAVKHVVEERRPEIVQIQHLHLEKMNVDLDMEDL